MINKSNNVQQKGFAHLFLILVLVVAAIIVLGLDSVKTKSNKLESSSIPVVNAEDGEGGMGGDAPHVMTATNGGKVINSGNESGHETSELEFESENENPDVHDLIAGDDNQTVEINKVGQNFQLNITTKNTSGKEIKTQKEATSSSNIATLKLIVDGQQTQLKVTTRNGEIVLSQEKNGKTTSASTTLPVTIDSATNTISVKTPSGQTNIVILPENVINTLLNSKALDNVTSLKLIQDTGTDQSKVVYEAKGPNTVKLLGIIPFNTNATLNVDVQSGTIQKLSQPWFLRYLGFLFTH